MSETEGAPRKHKVAPSAALIASVALHAVIIAVSAHYISSLTSPEKPPIFVDLALAEGEPHVAPLPPGLPGARKPDLHAEEPEPSALAGTPREPRPDTRVTGRGGSREATEKALHLSDSVDGLTLETDPTLLVPSSQLSRLDTGAERLSREDRRTTPNPMELTFIAVGTGARLSRITPSPTDPSVGGVGAIPTVAGFERGADPPTEDGQRPQVLGAAVAGSVKIAAEGVEHGSDEPDFRRSASVAVAHPAVRLGRASIQTTAHGRPADTVDSAEEVASLVQSLITASTAGGPLGQGPGGSSGPGDPGSDGMNGIGTKSRASGEGGSDGAATLGIQSYAQALTRKVYPYWEDALPMWARAEGRGGVAVIGVTISSDGAVHDIAVVRGSGIPEFDHEVARALAAASPYGPLPRAVRRTGLTLHIAFDAMNPAVGRAGPGPGKR
ncbi:MAG TPA: TonB family protein [Polyangiaceae bacterium]|jgi:TonB family protein|nr:TonB family protein [Polyangiaceae bacterium]